MKVIHVLLIIIIILVTLLGIKVINSKQQTNNIEIEQISKTNNDKLDLEEIKKIINKSEDINNYSLMTNTDKGAEIKYKDGKFVYILKRGKIYINDKEDSEKALIIVEDNKTAAYVNKQNIQVVDILKNRKNEFDSLINNCERYKINGIEKFNNYNCISLTAYSKYFAGEGWLEEELKQYNGKTIETNILIDKNTGVIMKTSSKIEEKETIQEYYYKFNCVTEEEVTIPDLSQYKIVQAD